MAARALALLAALAVAVPVGAESIGGAGAHTFSPLSFGADPTGERDSTDALQQTIDAALNATHERRCGNIGDPACGAALVDLQQGVFLTSRPLNITGNGGNWRVCCGSLLAAPSFFPRAGYMISVTGGNNGHQNIALRDLSLDGGLVANGLFLLNVLRGEVSEIYCVHFLTAGVTVEKGHEVDIHDSFLGQYIWDEKVMVNTNSSAIVLLGNDHWVHDCVIFSATGIGVLDTGGANGIEGMHIYGVGGLGGGGAGGYDWTPPTNAAGNVSLARGGIVLTAWGWQSRVVNNYFDGEDLVIQLGGTQCCKPPRCHDIAGIWVAFFQECQQCRGGQAPRPSRATCSSRSPRSCCGRSRTTAT